ncbi:MAG: hypothetical protein K0S47_567 [Herbinix sp.]|jgi:hypothetical protein|nr:hypothetical protein [Herbinix sp.]
MQLQFWLIALEFGLADMPNIKKCIRNLLEVTFRYLGLYCETGTSKLLEDACSPAFSVLMVKD